MLIPGCTTGVYLLRARIEFDIVNEGFGVCYVMRGGCAVIEVTSAQALAKRPLLKCVACGLMDLHGSAYRVVKRPRDTTDSTAR